MVFEPPTSVQRYHPFITALRKEARKPRLDKYSRIEFTRGTVNPGIKVTVNNFNRACHFLQGLIELFGTFGWKLVRDSSNSAGFKFENEVVMFEIKEPVKRRDITPTKSQMKDRFYWPRLEYIATDRLEFRITNAHSMNYKKTWYENNIPLEKQLDSITQAFSRAFESRRLGTIKHNEWKRQWGIE